MINFSISQHVLINNNQFRLVYSFIRNSRKPFSATKIVAPTSDKIAIHNVNQPGITNSNANSLMAMENVILALIIVNAFRLVCVKLFSVP